MAWSARRGRRAADPQGSCGSAGRGAPARNDATDPAHGARIGTPSHAITGRRVRHPRDVRGGDRADRAGAWRRRRRALIVDGQRDAARSVQPRGS
jgi:hypothetical protein